MLGISNSIPLLATSNEADEAVSSVDLGPLRHSSGQNEDF
jgi:hypothetical protein